LLFDFFFMVDVELLLLLDDNMFLSD